MIIKVREVYKEKIHNFNVEMIFPTHNLLFIEALNNEPLFIAENMKEVVIIMNVLNL